MIPASNYIMLSSSYEIQLKIDPVAKFACPSSDMTFLMKRNKTKTRRKVVAK